MDRIFCLLLCWYANSLLLLWGDSYEKSVEGRGDLIRPTTRAIWIIFTIVWHKTFCKCYESYAKSRSSGIMLSLSCYCSQAYNIVYCFNALLLNSLSFHVCKRSANGSLKAIPAYGGQTNWYIALEFWNQNWDISRGLHKKANHSKSRRETEKICDSIWCMDDLNLNVLPSALSR